MILAIPGAEGLFSHIKSALVKAGSSNLIKVDRSTRDELRDWKWLAGDIATRPTSNAEVVRHPPIPALATSVAFQMDGG